MRRYLRPIVALFCAALLTVGFAAPALAAPSAWSVVDVTLHDEQQQSTLIVSGNLPADVPLPYEGELAVPAGAKLLWIGEILGGPVSEDPAVQYTVSTAGGMDVYRFTLTTARTAQIEVTVPSSSTASGTTYTSALKWTAWQDLPQVRIGQSLAAGAQIVTPAEGATLTASGPSESYYTKTVTGAKAGDVLELAFSYTAPAAAATPVAAGTPASGTGSNTTTIVLIVVAVLVVFGLIGFAVYRGRVAEAAEAEQAAQPAAKGDKKQAQQVAAPKKAGASKSVILLVVIVAFLLIVIVKISSDNATPSAAGAGAAGGTSLTSVRNDAVADYDAALATGKPVYVLFHSLTCAPCVAISEVADEVIPEYADKIAFVNAITDDPSGMDLAAKFSFQYIPHSFFLAPDGTMVDEFEGAMEADQMRGYLDALIAK